MKRTAIGALLLAALCGSGCINFSGKVALIADYGETSGVPGGSYKLMAVGTYPEERELASDAITLLESERVQSKYSDVVPVKVTVGMREQNDSRDGYELLSGMFTFFTLGLWPTIMSDEIHCVVSLRNDTLNLDIPVVMKKRYMLGWLSIFPVPGWAAWRGNENDLNAGKIKVVRDVIEDNLSVEDARRYLIHRIVSGKAGSVSETMRQQDLIVGKFALRYAPEKWRDIQRIRTKISLMQNKISRYYSDLKAIGYDPYCKEEFSRMCDGYFRLKDEQVKAMEDLEQLYYRKEYRRVEPDGDNASDVTLDEILMKPKR